MEATIRPQHQRGTLKKAPMDWPAPVTAVAMLGLLFAVAGLLGFRQWDGTDQSHHFLGDVPWTIWRLVAGAAVVTFVVLFLFAVRLLRHTNEWGLTTTRSRRRAYLATAAVLVGGAMVLQIKVGQTPQLPVNRLDLRTRAVLFAGLITGVPWMALVWLAHDECAKTSRSQAIAATATSQSNDGSGNSASLGQLLQLWRLLVACIGAFAIGVVMAIITAGALRASFISVHPLCSERNGNLADVPPGTVCGESFPPSYVLFYGAFFAVLLTLIAAPLGAAWRARAVELVEWTFPLPEDGKPTEEWVAGRERLAKLLHLDVSILRNPLTALSLFTPLVVSTLAAFIPQLGN